MLFTKFNILPSEDYNVHRMLEHKMSNLCLQCIFLNLRAILLEFERRATGQEAVNKTKPWPGRGSCIRGREKARLFEPDVREVDWVFTGDLGI